MTSIDRVASCSLLQVLSQPLTQVASIPLPLGPTLNSAPGAKVVCPVREICMNLDQIVTTGSLRQNINNHLLHSDQ